MMSSSHHDSRPEVWQREAAAGSGCQAPLWAHRGGLPLLSVRPASPLLLHFYLQTQKRNVMFQERGAMLLLGTSAFSSLSSTGMSDCFVKHWEVFSAISNKSLWKFSVHSSPHQLLLRAVITVQHWALRCVQMHYVLIAVNYQAGRPRHKLTCTSREIKNTGPRQHGNDHRFAVWWLGCQYSQYSQYLLCGPEVWRWTCFLCLCWL